MIVIHNSEKGVGFADEDQQFKRQIVPHLVDKPRRIAHSRGLTLPFSCSQTMLNLLGHSNDSHTTLILLNMAHFHPILRCSRFKDAPWFLAFPEIVLVSIAALWPPRPLDHELA
jgi:hypothetical protein